MYKPHFTVVSPEIMTLLADLEVYIDAFDIPKEEFIQLIFLRKSLTRFKKVADCFEDSKKQTDLIAYLYDKDHGRVISHTDKF